MTNGIFFLRLPRMWRMSNVAFELKGRVVLCAMQKWRRCLYRKLGINRFYAVIVSCTIRMNGWDSLCEAAVLFTCKSCPDMHARKRLLVCYCVYPAFAVFARKFTPIYIFMFLQRRWRDCGEFIGSRHPLYWCQMAENG